MSVSLFTVFFSEVVCHILIKKRKIRAQQHTLYVPTVIPTSSLCRWPSWKILKCQMFELIEIPEESSFTPLPTPYVSLELFIFGAKYLPQIILYC